MTAWIRLVMRRNLWRWGLSQSCVRPVSHESSSREVLRRGLFTRLRCERIQEFALAILAADVAQRSRA